MRRPGIGVVNSVPVPDAEPSAWFANLRDYLFGAGTVIDPMPTYGTFRRTFYLDDAAACAADWLAVGNDMRAFQWTLTSIDSTGGGQPHGKSIEEFGYSAAKPTIRTFPKTEHLGSHQSVGE